MNLYNEIEHACQTLKHVPQNIDPTDLRSLLRRTQHTIDTLTPLLAPQTITIHQTHYDDHTQYTLTLTTNLTHNEYQNLLHLISEQ